MIRTAIFITVLCLAASSAEKDVTIVAIYQLTSGRTGPPYNLEIIVTGLDDKATLLDAMTKARNDEKMKCVQLLQFKQMP